MDEQNGVLSDSPSAPSEAPTAPAPSAPSDPGFGFDPQQQHVPYTRFKEVNDNFRQLQQQVAQEREQIRQYLQAQQAQQQRPQTPQQGLTPEELDAGKILRRLMQQHPDFEDYRRNSGQVAQIQQRMAEAHLATGRSIVQQLATRTNLPVTPEHVKYYEGLVAETVRLIPGAVERFNRGDLSVLAEAWPQVQQFLSGFQRQAAQQSATAHQNIRNLPPRMRGSAPGQPLPPKLTPEMDSRDFIRQMHADAARVANG